MSDWSSTFWGSTAGLFGEEDEDDAFDPDRQVSIVFLHEPNPFRFFVLQPYRLNAHSTLIKA